MQIRLFAFLSQNYSGQIRGLVTPIFMVLQKSYKTLMKNPSFSENFRGEISWYVIIGDRNFISVSQENGFIRQQNFPRSGNAEGISQRRKKDNFRQFIITVSFRNNRSHLDCKKCKNSIHSF